MMKFVNFMKKQGLVMVESTRLVQQDQGPAPQIRKGRQGKESGMTDHTENASIITVYRNAVPKVMESKRDSSSSEDQLDTSDELAELNVAQLSMQGLDKHNNVIQFIAENPVE